MIDYILQGKTLLDDYAWQQALISLMKRLNYADRAEENLYIGYHPDIFQASRQDDHFSILHTRAFHNTYVYAPVLLKATKIYVVNKEHWLNAVTWATDNLPQIVDKISIWPVFPCGFEPPSRKRPVISILEPDTRAEFFHNFVKKNYEFEEFDLNYCYFSPDLFYDVSSMSNVYMWDTFSTNLSCTPNIIVCMDNEVTNPIIEGWSKKIPYIKPKTDFSQQDAFISSLKELVNKLQILNSLSPVSDEYIITRKMLLNY